MGSLNAMSIEWEPISPEGTETRLPARGHQRTTSVMFIHPRLDPYPHLLRRCRGCQGDPSVSATSSESSTFQIPDDGTVSPSSLVLISLPAAMNNPSSTRASWRR